MPTVTTVLLLSTLALLIALFAAGRAPSPSLVGLHIPGRLHAFGFVWRRSISHWQPCADRHAFEQTARRARALVIEVPR